MKRHELINSLQAHGLEVDLLETGRLIRCKAEGDKGSQRSGWYVFHDDVDMAVCLFGDWRTGSREVWTSRNTAELSQQQRQEISARIKQSQYERQVERRKRWAENHNKNIQIWNQSLCLNGEDPASLYLASRGLITPKTRALRYHPSLEYWHERKLIGHFPAMLASVTSIDGDLITIHRTFLNLDGTKAEVDTVKKLCPTSGSMANSTIKLYDPAPRPDGSLGIGVAEGLETSIAAKMLFNIPVWSAVSAHGLASFTPSREIKQVYIFADNDVSQTGQKAAADLAERLTLDGYTVRVHLPQIGDWADELVRLKEVGV